MRKICSGGFILFSAFLVVFFLWKNTSLGQKTIRCATVAPEGTKWADIAKEVSTELEQRVGLKISWYFSGSAGDEPEIAKKLKEGKLDCVAVTGNGMTYLIPPMRVLELPMLFKSLDEVDRIRKEISSLLEKIAKNYKIKFISLGELGTVHVFSKIPIRSIDDVKGKRTWVWKGDFLAEYMGKVLQESYGINPVPVPLYDVPKYLQTIDVLYNTSYALISLGWDKGIKYYITQPLTLSFIGILMREEVFNQLDVQKQKEVENLLKDFIEKVSRMNRENNQKAFEILRRNGVQPISLPDGEIKKIEEAFQQKVWKSLQDKLYPSWLLTEILTRLSRYRATAR